MDVHRPFLKFRITTLFLMSTVKIISSVLRATQNVQLPQMKCTPGENMIVHQHDRKQKFFAEKQSIEMINIT